MLDKKETTQIKISVRALVEYAYRQGSIESGFQSGAALIDGTKAHQAVQSGYREGDRKEVPLQAAVELDGLAYLIEGRCDGLLEIDNRIVIDEIKSTSGELESIQEDSRPVHWAQAMCYAYAVAVERGIETIDVQLTYVKVGTDEVKRFRRTESAESLHRFMIDLVERYAPFARMLLEHERRRSASIRQLAFPFDSYREGQRKLAGAVYKTVTEETSLFAKAPTGIGKTMSTLFPSVKAMGEGLARRIMYVTAKTITRTAAEEAFGLMAARGLALSSVTLTAKEKICFKDKTVCGSATCEFADGYYDRINGAILDLLSSETQITRQVVEAYARKHRVCPFEFSLDAAYAADAVICDYNYVFDPRVSLKRLFEEQKKQTILLVDEAHNLVDRGRDMFSAQLAKSDFLALKRGFKGVHAGIYETSGAVNQWFIGLKKRMGDERSLVQREQPEELAALVAAFAEQAESALSGGLQEGASDELKQQLLDAYFASLSYARIAELYDERYIAFAELEKQSPRLKLYCLDPSHLLRQAVRNYRARVYFSATLSPLSYYMDMLGGEEDDYAVVIPSPFSRDQLEVRIQPLSTRFRDRERTKPAIAEALGRLVRERPGNLLAFFPSYEYLNAVYELFRQDNPDVPTIVQDVRMSEEEREQFLASFQASENVLMPDESCEDTPAYLGFAVLGGIFSEGIDLQGDRLTGVAVVGVGLPQLSLERNIIKEYFDRIGKNGYDYAYVFPGMNKVQQAGGRLIRSEQDYGTLLLIDDRFLQPRYQTLLPAEWREYVVVR